MFDLALDNAPSVERTFGHWAIFFSRERFHFSSYFRTFIIGAGRSHLTYPGCVELNVGKGPDTLNLNDLDLKSLSL